jgi:SHS2 domain-containing protein
VEHVGEWKVQLVADSVEELFAEIARLISRAVGTSVGQPGAWEPVTVAARDLPTLLADWANELLGRSEAESRAFGELRSVRIQHGGAEARVSSEMRGRPVHHWTSPLKAATYHGLGIAERHGRWRATVLFDI